MISISIRFDFDFELETLREKTDGGWMFRARVARIGAQRIEGIEETNDDGGVIADRGRDRVSILFFARSGAIRFDSIRRNPRVAVSSRGGAIERLDISRL